MRPLAAIAACAALASATAFASDWPQWRGPTRDGIVADSPPLVEEFPKEGPKKLWESEAIPGGEYNGGYAQPVVAGGKVFVFAHNRFQTPIAKRVLTKDGLMQLGWQTGMPDDLAAALDEARASEPRAKLKDYNEISKWADEWVKTNEKAEWRAFRYPAKQRLLAGPDALATDLLRKLAPIVDREFASQEEFDAWTKAQGIGEAQAKEIMKHVPTTERDASDILLCLDAATGKTAWKKEMPGNRYTYATGTSTPTVSQGRVYFLNSSAVAFCLSVADGSVVWQSKPIGAAPNVGCTASSILLAGGKAIVGTGAGLYALDAGTGEVAWKSVGEKERRRPMNGDIPSATLWNFAGKPYVLFASWGNPGRLLYCIELETGKTVWTVEAGISGTTPAVFGNIMVFSSFDPEIGVTAYALAIPQPVKLWSVPFKDGLACPVIYNGFVYVVGGANGTYGDINKGRAVCIELGTGRKVWDEILGPPELSSPLVADGKLIADVPPWLYLIKASPEKYQLLGKANLGICRWTSSVLSDGRIFVRTSRNVACYDLRK